MPRGNWLPDQACVVCGAVGWETALTIRRPEDATLRILEPSGTVQIARCRSCGMMMTHPLPPADRIADLYPAQTYPCYSEATRNRGFKRWVLHRVMRVASTACSEPRRHLTRLVFFPLLRRVGGVPTPQATRRILDIGCGDGVFLEAVQAAGWEAVGVEMGQEPAAAARARGLRVETGTVETLSFPDVSFSAVRLWHVLEHVLDPAAALRRIRRWLIPGGELILGIPNAGSLCARLFGPRWTAWELPRHLYHFTPKTVRRLLEQEGFTSVRVAYCSVGTGVSSLGMWWSRQVWMRAMNLMGDMVLDLLRCGDSLEVRAIRPTDGGDSA